MLRHPKINRHSGILSTINHKQVYRAGSWVHAAPSGLCISNSSLFKTNFCHLYNYISFTWWERSMHTFNNPFHSITPKILKHLKFSLKGDCEYLYPNHMNPTSIEGTLGTEQFYCCSSARYRRSSVTDTLPISYFCYLCHQGHGLLFGVPICVHEVAVFKLSIYFIPCTMADSL